METEKFSVVSGRDIVNLWELWRPLTRSLYLDSIFSQGNSSFYIFLANLETLSQNVIFILINFFSKNTDYDTEKIEKNSEIPHKKKPETPQIHKNLAYIPGVYIRNTFKWSPWHWLYSWVIPYKLTLVIKVHLFSYQIQAITMNGDGLVFRQN